MKSKFFHLLLVLNCCIFDHIVFGISWERFLRKTTTPRISAFQNLGNPEISQLWYMPSETLAWVYVIKGMHKGLSVDFNGDNIVISRPIFKLEILCSAKYPVEWIHSTEPISESLYKKTFDYDRKLDHYNAHLQLKFDSRRSTKNLTFKCTSTKNKYSYTIQRVYWPEFTPATVEGPVVEKISWNLGDSNRALTCEASGNPKPIITWGYLTLSGQKNNNCCSFVSQKENSKLEFEEIRADMAGRYICKAENEMRSMVKVFIVMIQGVSVPPTISPTSISTTSTNISIIFENERTTAAAAKGFSDLQKINLNESFYAMGHLTVLSVGIVIMFGVLLLVLLCSGIAIVVLLIKKYRREDSRRKLDQSSYFSLKEIGFHRTESLNQLKI